MSRTLRTSFAAPLVLTLAVAPACVVHSGPGAGGPPPSTGTASSVSADPTPRPPVANPPRVSHGDPTTPVTPGPDAPTRQPATGTATPPGPSAPDQAQQAPPTTTPSTTWSVYLNPSDKQCYAAVQVKCTPRATCNPPAPRAMESCPTGMTAGQNLTIVETSPGHCSLTFPKPASCGANPSCDPPRSRPIDCP